MITEKSPSRLWSPDYPFSPARVPVFYGWIIVAVGIVGLMGSMPGQSSGFAPFTGPVMEALGLSELAMSTSFLVGTLLSGFLMSYGGRFANVYGLRKSMVYSCMLFGLGLLYLSVCDYITLGVHKVFSFVPQSWIAFIVLTFGMFVSRFFGQGMLPVISRNMMGKWFNVRRGSVLAMVGIGSSMIFAANPKILHFLVESMGWRMAWILLGLILLILFPIISYIFFREDPEESGLQMDGGYVAPVKRKVNPELVVHHDFTLAEAKRDYSFWVYTIILAWKGLFFTGYTFLLGQLAPEMGVSVGLLFDLYIPIAITSIIVNVIGGIWADFTRLKVFLLIQSISLVAAPIGILLMPSFFGSFLLVAGMGFSWGTYGVIVNNMYPRFYGRRNLSEIVGCSMGLTIVASALGPIFYSGVKSLWGSYIPVMYISVLIPLGMCIASLRADNPQRKLNEV